MQLFSDTPESAGFPAGQDTTPAGEDTERIERLEQQVSELFREVRELRQRLEGPATG
jgi:uncharacterized protein YceH (UPF0502 family)